MTMLLLACLRGNIFIYQGEELGLPQAQIDFDQLRDPEAIANWPLTLGRDGARTPMPWRAAGLELNAGVQPWLPVVPEHLALAVDRQERDPASQLAYTRHVLAFRNRHEALVSGALQVLEASDDILAFERRTSDQRLLCVFNFADEAREWQPPGASSWHRRRELRRRRAGGCLVSAATWPKGTVRDERSTLPRLVRLTDRRRSRGDDRDGRFPGPGAARQRRRRRRGPAVLFGVARRQGSDRGLATRFPAHRRAETRAQLPWRRQRDEQLR